MAQNRESAPTSGPISIEQDEEEDVVMLLS